MLTQLAAAAPGTGAGFSWVNLVVLVVVAAVAWPLYRSLRAKISRDRRERWAREERDSAGFTPETDPDLRHDDDQA